MSASWSRCTPGKVLRTGIGQPAKPFGPEVVDRARRKELTSRLAQAADTADPLDRAFGALAQAADPRDRLIHLAVSQTVAVAKYYDPAPSKATGYDYGGDLGAIGKIQGGLSSLQ